MAQRGDGRPRPIPGVLDPDEQVAVEQRFGVAASQVVRDHVISHALAAIASIDTDDVVFFGGTALSRTHLADVRLSEDIDLIARGDRGELGDRIEATIVTRFRRTFGTVTFTPHIRETRHPDPSVMQVGTTRVQVQLLSSEGYPDWPTEIVDIEQRYSDAPSARLRVLTPAAFVASKLSSWNDRAAPRDLYDLWALAVAGKVDAEAEKLFGRYGPYTSASKVAFTRLPTDAEWYDALAHQCKPVVSPAQAAAAVQKAVASLIAS
ncbi:nucleotidyl transferase AbiEii/AbiGii toxin family protein [Microbacterium kribbense]